MSVADGVALKVRSAPAAKVAAGALAGGEEPAWVVGGAVRDALLGAEVVDVDLAVSRGTEERIAREIAAAAGGFVFELSAEYGTWRVVSGDRSWHLDVAGLRSDDIESDLRARDFTVDAVAIDLTGGQDALLDPTGGVTDAAERTLRAASDQSFSDDPLRLLRAARIAVDLGLELDQQTIRLARSEAPRVSEPAGERQFAEFSRMLSGTDPMRSLDLLDELELTAGFLPELEELRGVGQNRNHHLDVHGHTLAVLEQILVVESDLSDYAGDQAPRMDDLLDEVLAEEVTRRTALRFGALLHDMGKPVTRKEDGEMVTFMGHDEAGAEIAEGICSRFRLGRRLTSHLSALVRNHLRLGFLIHEVPLTPHRVYDYLRACDPVAADVSLLSVADRLSARGSGPIASDEMVRAHLDLAKEMFEPALDWHRDGPPGTPLDGNEIAEELGLEPGPEIGRIIEGLRAATYAGEVSGPEEARAVIREIAAHDR